VAVVPLGDYDTAHPDRADLIVEVAESSLSVDRGVKLRLYAACGVPEYWVVDVIAKCVEVYTQPSGDKYGKMVRYDHGQSIRPTRFSDITVQLADLMR
jgi:Uma2 family endonuclease